MNTVEHKRELWVDNVKAIACLLVVLGHLMQGFVASGILPAEGFFSWFNRTVYCFHVPLFFICSGYLYQKRTQIDSFGAWGKHILQKLLTLGIPYVTFTLAVWAVKTLSPGSGSVQVGSLVETLFLEPTAPYWYLYCLFFIFLVTLPLRSRRHALIVGIIALAMKAAAVYGLGERCFALSKLLANEIWFVLGMLLCMGNLPRRWARPAPFLAAGLVFLGLSVAVTAWEISFKGLDFSMGLLACAAVIGACAALERAGTQSPVMTWLAGYTMPVFLMHSIFAATLRTALIKFGVVSPWIHIPAGLAAAIVGPILTAMVMKKLKYPEFFLYPGKFIRIK